VVVRVIPEAPSVGQNVTLSVEGGLEPLRHFDWYRGRLADGSTRIFSYFPGQERPQRNGVQFTGREVGFPNGSLLLRGTQANDSGTYQVALQLVPQGPDSPTLYGPESTRIDPPGPVNLTLGSPLTLTCVADSVPALSYSWILNGNKLPQSRSSLTFDLTTLNLDVYKCQADNPVSGLTANAEIEVLGEQPGTTPASVSDTQSTGASVASNALFCACLSLPAPSCLCPPCPLPASPNHRVAAASEVGQGAVYRGTPHWCHPSPDPVPLCADGPDSARIDLPGLIALTLGSPLTLMCVSDSVPAPSYRWGLNSTDTTETGIILTFNPTTVDHQGTYKCQAHNPITDRTAWASVAMLVTGRG
uniref:Ig-like domain-containing protein n=1 Tax=Chelonoidis abingdonii TaxID=106734 RepID=A0A8C0HAX9_CHEAB